jgi:MoxR-like ATPase
MTPNSLTQCFGLLDKAEIQHLPKHGSWPQAVHQFEQTDIYALKTALAAQRPLLLRGEPGTGKSQLARAAAYALKRMFIYEVIDAHTESQDLLWRFDAVARLAEAQSLSGQNLTEPQRQGKLDSKRFISPGAIWWALDYPSADAIYNNSLHQLTRPETPEGWQQGSVLLIDEIDKANLELPNGLLEILGNNSVSIPWLKTHIGQEQQVPPLVIITTNEERELPAAFVRRCLVHNMTLPKEPQAFKNTMVARGLLHFKDYCDEDICKQTADLLLQDRQSAEDLGLPTKPGQAEYLDILRALSVLAPNDKVKQRKYLKQINQFALKKYPAMYQD